MKRSVYLQISDDIKRKVRLGLLQKDERLPSCRELAMTLGVNPNTVQRAYTELEEQGIIYTVPKKGVYISPTGGKNDVERAVKDKLSEFKNAGVSREKLLELISEVYGDKI